MVAGLRVTPAPEIAPREPQPDRKSDLLSTPVRFYLARLAALHDEAAETAHLANLLGRAPWAASLLGLAALATATLTARTVLAAPLAAWVILMALAVAAVGREYGAAIKAPFDRPALRNFARSLSAILIYAGAAWGAGTFLALPPGLGLAGSFAFTALLPAFVAGTLRARDMTLCFIAPMVLTSTFCSLMRSASLASTAGIVAGGLAAAATAQLLERRHLVVTQHS